MGCCEKKWKVLLLDTKRSNPNHYICLAIDEALRCHPDVESVHKVELGAAISTARRADCNLFIAFDGEELHATICHRLKQICGVAVLWVTEDPYELPVNLRNASIFDRVFTNDSASVASYGETGAHLPLAASKQLHYRSIGEESAYRYDLFFAGTAWPNRVELFRKLVHAIDGLKAKLALSVNVHLPKVDIGIPSSAYSWRTPNSEFVRFSNVSRAVLTLHRDFSTSPGAPTSAATPGPRLFEVAMAGGFQLVDGGLPEVNSYFKDGEEIVTFRNENDCVEKLHYYLTHPEQRRQIAIAAQKRALEEHTYGNRVNKLLKSVGTLERSRERKTKTRPRILVVTHNLIGATPWGGVEVYQDLVRESLQEKYEFIFYAPEQYSGGRVCVLRDEKGEQLDRFEFSEASDGTLLSCDKREREFSQLLIRYSVAAVHFHHFIYHVPSLPIIARGMGVKTMLSLHDYYAVCHHFNLIGWSGQYCEVEHGTESTCDLCLKRTVGGLAGSQAARRAFFRKVLSAIDVLHANTEGVAERFRTVYGNLVGNPDIQVKGIPVREGGSYRRKREETRLRVAVLGNFIHSKGAEVVVSAFEELRGDPVDFVIYGYVHPDYHEKLASLRLDNVRVHGPFAPGEVDDELAFMDVSLHASIWPETYCMTLSEAWLAGLVPIVSKIGALRERVRDGDNGFTFPAGNVGALVDLIRSLAATPLLLERARKGVRTDDVVSCSGHMAWLDEVYERLVANAVVSSNCESEGLNLRDCGVFLNSPLWLRPSNGEGIVLAAPVHGSKEAGGAATTSAAVRLFRHLKNNGLRATARRVRSELALRLR